MDRGSGLGMYKASRGFCLEHTEPSYVRQYPPSKLLLKPAQSLPSKLPWRRAIAEIGPDVDACKSARQGCKPSPPRPFGILGRPITTAREHELARVSDRLSWL